MVSVHPYLNFPGNTEQAFQFYSGAFQTPIDGLVRFREMGGEEMGLSGADLDKVAHAALTLPGGTLLMATDAMESLGQKLTFGNNFHIYVEAPSPEEARRLFGALSEGGSVGMALERTPWAELYGDLTDRFGVRWMVAHTGEVKFEMAPAAG